MKKAWCFVIFVALMFLSNISYAESQPQPGTIRYVVHLLKIDYDNLSLTDLDPGLNSDVRVVEVDSYRMDLKEGIMTVQLPANGMLYRVPIFLSRSAWHTIWVSELVYSDDEWRQSFSVIYAIRPNGGYHVVMDAGPLE